MSSRSSSSSSAAAAAASSSSSHQSKLRPSDRRGGDQFEQRDHALTRVQKLFGLSSLAPGQQYSSTRLAYVPLELLRVTAEEKAALNALQPGKVSMHTLTNERTRSDVEPIPHRACPFGRF